MVQRNPDAFATFLTPEAVFFSDGEALRGKAAVVEGWRQFFVGREAPFSWSPEIIEVLSSGTLALSSVDRFETLRGSESQPSTRYGAPRE